jgi:hypothetical protein
MRLDPGPVAEPVVSLVMIDHHDRTKSDQFPTVPAQPVRITTIQAEAEKIIAGTRDKLTNHFHIGLNLAATGEKTVEMRHGILQKTEDLFAHAFKDICQAEQGAEGIAVGIVMGRQQDMIFVLYGL